MRFTRGASRTRDGRRDLGSARLVNDEDHNFVLFPVRTHELPFAHL